SRVRQRVQHAARRQQVLAGFSPSTAANSEDTGGSVPAWWATCAGTPCASSPRVSVSGSVRDRPAIISEKKTPIESAVPVFWNVERMPEAAPRWDAGTLLMMDAELGALNMPTPSPFTVISAANAQYEKFTGRNSRPTKLTANSRMAPAGEGRAPKRSESVPNTGPDTRNAAVSGSRKMPAQSGVEL